MEAKRSVALGVTMLAAGIAYLMFMVGLRGERKTMKAAGLIHAESHFPPSFTLITAVVLFLIGIAAISSMVFQVGPF
jgi:putative membrane protein